MQTFLLRHNWIGGMSNFIMVITTSGRKSGKQYSTPIGYIYDGDDLISLPSLTDQNRLPSRAFTA